MKSSFSMPAMQPPPPGTKSTSHESMAARSSRCEKVRLSTVIGRPPSEATRTCRSGVRERNWCGPVKSSCVTPSYTGTTMLIGCVISGSRLGGHTLCTITYKNILYRVQHFMQLRTKIRSRRGRPREFDEDQALENMQRRLWTTGLSGVSVDGIARAAGLNRPSLAAAFGDKNAIYAQAAAQFAAMMDARLSEAIEIADLGTALKAAFDAAIDI